MPEPGSTAAWLCGLEPNGSYKGKILLQRDLLVLAGIVLGEWERIQRKEYMEACSLSLDEIRRIAENFEKDYNIIVTADHGGHERSHGSTEKEDMLIPIVCMESDFEAGRKYEHASICDIDLQSPL